VLNQGERDLPIAVMFRIKVNGVLQVRTSALFGAKNLGFFEIYGMSVQSKGVEPVRSEREGVNF